MIFNSNAILQYIKKTQINANSICIFILNHKDINNC